MAFVLSSIVLVRYVIKLYIFISGAATLYLGYVGNVMKPITIKKTKDDNIYKSEALK